MPGSPKLEAYLPAARFKPLEYMERRQAEERRLKEDLEAVFSHVTVLRIPPATDLHHFENALLTGAVGAGVGAANNC